MLSKTKPTPCRRQYSSMLTVPNRLCSTSCRGLVRPSTPARTLGFAAASTTQSTRGSDSKSLAILMSPWMTVTPSWRRARRLVSLPGRLRLSTPKSVCPAPLSTQVRASVVPAKPHTPEIKMRMVLGLRRDGDDQELLAEPTPHGRQLQAQRYGPRWRTESRVHRVRKESAHASINAEASEFHAVLGGEIH